MKTILVLFPNEWDRAVFAGSRYRDRYRFLFHGEDMLAFPRNLKLLTFDVMSFIEETVRRYESVRPDGVLSTDEYLGAAVAAAVAQRLRLPGAPPEQVLLAQHKYFSRLCQLHVVPEATPDFFLIPAADYREPTFTLSFPFFLKPVKGTFSVFAVPVDSPRAVRKHLCFSALERFCLRRVITPFNDLIRTYTNFQIDGANFIGEELLQGVQVTLDGFAYGGEIEVMGIVDSVMFPGTQTFARFEYPSKLCPSVQDRMAELARRLVRGMGYDYGQFNIEMFYDEKTDRIRIIEINPRLSYQFADLYESVDGSNTYEILLDLTLGLRPGFRRGRGKYPYAASFVMRTFSGRKLKAVPSASQLRRFGERYSDSRIQIYGKPGQYLYPQMKTVGSYRCAVINTAARTAFDLSRIYQDALELLRFEIV